MLPVGSVYSSLVPNALSRAEALRDAQPAVPGALTDGLRAAPGAQPRTEGFGEMLDGLVGATATKQSEAAELTKRVLLGESDQLHQSVIAMQESSVAFTLMVEVRNKLVESYQELMRMQV